RRLEDGTEVDSSQGSQLLRFTLGAEQVIPGFENAVLALEPGQPRTVTLSPEDGYGPRRDDLVAAMPRNQVPPDVRVGQHLQLPLDDEGQLPVIVTDVSETTVTFDANHPLAGQTLIFDIELVDAS
ncbi:MAG: peptidylprolyl isomerase, partial [Rhodothermales bacterium]